MPLKTSSQHNVLITRFPYEAVLSGEEWHTISLATALRAKGHNIYFLGSCPVLMREFAMRGFHTTAAWAGTLPVSFKALVGFFLLWPFMLYSLWSNFFRLRKRHSMDVVYMLSFTEKVLLTPLCVLLRIKVIWVEHQRFGKWMYANPLRIPYVLFSYMVTVVGVSPFYEKSIRTIGVATKNIRTILNGVDETLFTQEGSVWNKSPVGTIRIACIARLSEDKGVDVLIQALAILCKEEPHLDLMCFIQGEGQKKDELEQEVEILNLRRHVKFLTPYKDIPRSDIPAFYRSLDIFVLPSRHLDPFGLVVAEAMMCGVATVVTDVCGVATGLRHEEEAYIIPAGDVSSLKEALQRLAVDASLREHIAKKGREKALQAFTLERMTNEFEALFDARV